ncbi:MAG: hypothetical protein J6N52_06655 [Clostridia bacterium]|nr:hypothetical protein [Clostridia bacterium]
MKIKKIIRNILLGFHEWNKSKWFIFSCLHTLAGVWFSLILSFFGESWHLITVTGNGQKILTKLGFSITLITVGWTLFCFTAQRYSEWYESSTSIYKPTSGELILNEVNKGVISICKNKINLLIKQIHRIKNGKADFVTVQGSPCEQLGLITAELNKNLSYLLTQQNYNIRTDDISVRIFYNFPMENPNVWKVADNKTTNTNVNIDKLLSPNTTFFCLLNKKDGNFIFCNSKEDALRHGLYTAVTNDEYNEKHELLGSIMGHKYSLGYEENEYIRFMVFVSTYSKSFIKPKTSEDLKHAKENIHHYIIDEYLRRISIELELLYISFLKEKYDNVQNTN